MSTDPPAIVQMTGVVKVYRTGLVETQALRDLSMEVEAGEFVTITGPSGSGKTTFLNVAGLLDGFERGDYWLDGVDVRRLGDREMSRIRNEKIGFIFQSFNLIPDLDVFDNVDVPLRYRGLRPGERKERDRAARSTRSGSSSRLRHLPSQLSGGQQQRVAIARVLAGDPKLILADEPTGNLDSVMAREIMDLLGAHQRAGHHDHHGDPHPRARGARPPAAPHRSTARSIDPMGRPDLARNARERRSALR